LGHSLGTKTDAGDLAGDVCSAIIAEVFEINACWKGLPLEVEHTVDRLNLDPPAASLHGLANQIWIVAIGYDVLVAIFDVCILKGNFALSLLLLAVRHLKPSYFHLHLVLRLGLGCQEKLFVRRHLKDLTLLVLLVKKAVLAVSAGDELLLVLQRHF
jgi:hypothetical protein